jgi:hypothetical protein
LIPIGETSLIISALFRAVDVRILVGVVAFIWLVENVIGWVLVDLGGSGLDQV